MKRLLSSAVVAFVAALACVPAQAWGPKTGLALVNAGMNIAAREGRVPLDKLMRDIQEGAALSISQIEEIYPNYETDIVNAIEAEMYLLQTVRGPRLDPYFGFRLGMLGKMVADATGPMMTSLASVRGMYYADVEENIDRATLGLMRHVSVDAKAYFPRVMREAALRDESYTKEYKDGIGFAGQAKAALSEDATRSVTAIADVWLTVLTENVVHANLNEAGVRAYILGCAKYYVRQDKITYLDAVIERLSGLTTETADLRRQIGDILYEGRHFDKAMAEYNNALRLSPGNREVAKRISGYYIDQGDAQMKTEDYDAALVSFQKALDADALNAAAEEKRLAAQKQIADRAARNAAATEAIDAGDGLWQKADQATLNNRFIEALSLLSQAESKYRSITNEFPMLYKQVDTSLKDLAYRMRELKDRIVADAQSLSGSGFMTDVPASAAAARPALGAAALETIKRLDLDAQTEQLRRGLQTALEIR